jgi:hypothetical protein
MNINGENAVNTDLSLKWFDYVVPDWRKETLLLTVDGSCYQVKCSTKGAVFISLAFLLSN